MFQLDGLRGIAALVVMGYHLRHVFGFGAPFSRGYLFVDFFFLLSGFVLAGAIEAPTASPFSARDFLRRRVVRLWPTVAAGALLGAAVTWWLQGGAGVAPALLLALAMVPLAWAGRVDVFPLNGPQWSILFELLANVAHALLLRRLSSRTLAAVTGMAGLALIWTVGGNGSNTLGPQAPTWIMGLPRVAFAYTLGILLARGYRTGRGRVRCPWLLPFAILAAVPFLAWAATHVVGNLSGDLLAVMLVMPVLFWLTACSPAPASAAAWLRPLGAISFPLYAVHLPILRLIGAINTSPAAAFVAVVVSAVLAGLLSVLLDPAGPWFARRAKGAAATGLAPELATVP